MSTLSAPSDKTITTPPTLSPSTWRMAATIARREVRDTLRDWRLVVPILGLTLFFPLLMTFVAQQMAIFLDQYSSELIGTRSVPLLLMVVGFFPTSFSLVIALEAFVGEKERKSLEPLLSTPLTNKQLYLGKMIAAVIPPVLASYVGIAVYTIGISLILAPMATHSLILVIVLTTAQAVLMVAASVVVSSQTTSVRAANMLASFIIVPVALILQFEAYQMVYEKYTALWWIVLAVVVTTIIFIRIGVQLFDREQLLGRNIDFIRFGWAFRFVWQRFSGRGADGAYPNVRQWYASLFRFLPQLRLPILLLLLTFIASWVLGYVYADRFPLPTDLLNQLRSAQMSDNLAEMQDLLNSLPAFIFAHNIRAMLIVAIVGTITFGVASVLVFMLPWGVIAFVTAQFASVGENPFVFVGATVVPHGLVEITALLLVVGAALRWQAVIISPPGSRTISEQWLEAGADYGRVLVGLGVPLFIIAALLEGFLTPLAIMAAYG